MEDKQIVGLFYQRSEQAITELAAKYGALCLKISMNILGDRQDAEECVNDAYLGAWNSIPPQSPETLRPYICRIVRDLALKRYRASTALKRDGFAVSLAELEGCIPDDSLEERLSAEELTAEINAFLATLRRDDRVMFLRRYWLAEPLPEISAAFGITPHNASVRLSRIRGRLREYLKSGEVSI